MKEYDQCEWGWSSWMRMITTNEDDHREWGWSQRTNRNQRNGIVSKVEQRRPLIAFAETPRVTMITITQGRRRRVLTLTVSSTRALMIIAHILGNHTDTWWSCTFKRLHIMAIRLFHSDHASTQRSYSLIAIIPIHDYHFHFLRLRQAHIFNLYARKGLHATATQSRNSTHVKHIHPDSAWIEGFQQLRFLCLTSS